MKKTLITIPIISALTLGWAVLCFAYLEQGWGLKPIAAIGDVNGFAKAIKNKIDNSYLGNAAMAIVADGEMVDTYHVSKGKLVSNDTVFGAASLGKWVTAVGVMKLVEAGRLSLDTPVSEYVRRWKLPASQFDNEKVTLRLLLSHTAGIEDGLGHDGFPPGTPVQPLVEHLTQANDADPGVSGKVAVTMEPGTEWAYSGGSYNLIQLIIEDVTGLSFQEFMHSEIFVPLHMLSSGFEVDRSAENVAEYFGENATLVTYPNYTSLAATGLYSNIGDLHKFMVSQIPSTALAHPGPRVLTDESLQMMRTPLASVGGIDIWGAGVMLFADNNQGDFIIGHGGKSPYLNATVRLNPASGDGFIMLQTGNDEAFSSNMATLWTVWQTGKPDIYIINSQLDKIIVAIIIGFTLIVIGAIVVNVFVFRRKTT